MKWAKGFLWVLFVYSAFHFYISGIKQAPQQKSGDFFTAFPPYWAWTINPKLIKENEVVTHWLGPEKTEVPDPSKPGTTQLVQNRTWNYGPVLHFVTYPLLFVRSFAKAISIWLFLCYTFLFVTLWIWYQWLFIENKLHSIPVLVLYLSVWLNFSPMFEALTQKNIEILEMMLISLAFYFASRKKDKLAGIWLGCAIMTKFLPLIFIPYLILKSRWRLLTSTFVTLLFIGGVTELLLGWENSYTLSFAMGSNSLSLASRFVTIENQAFSGWIYRLFTSANIFSMESFPFDFLVISNPELAKYVLRLFLVFLGGIFGYLFYRRRKQAIHPIEIAIISTVMVTACKWNHPYYLIFLAIAFSVALQMLVAASKTKEGIPWLGAAWFCVAYGFVGLFFPGTVYGKVFQLFSINFYQAYMYLTVAIYGTLLILAYLGLGYVRNVPINSMTTNET